MIPISPDTKGTRHGRFPFYFPREDRQNFAKFPAKALAIPLVLWYNKMIYY